MSTHSETLRDLVSRYAATAVGAASAPGFSAHDLERISVPDSRAARRAEAICRDSSSVSLANHCFRSYAWGALLGIADGISWDAELFYVASMLHDLGLTEAYDRGGCFESDGAQAAREILALVGWERPRIDTVAEAIYLHMHDVTADDSAEARLLAFGTSADVSGTRALEIAAVDRSFVLARFPRLAFKQHFIALFEDQATRKPTCIVHRYVNELGLRERILDAPYDE